MRYYLAIDQGTHASRACLFDQAGHLVSEHTETIQLKRIDNIHIEQDADEIVNSVKQAVARLLLESDKKDNIVACGIAIQRSSVVAWQEDGTALSPVLSWQDTRGYNQVADLQKNEDEIQQLSGLPLSAHYGASKLHYLLNDVRHRSISTETLRLSPLISYLLFHILEEHPYIVDHSNAQRTQLFNIAELGWSPRLSELFKVPLQTLPDCVPVLNNTDKAHGNLAGTEIPVSAISGDQNAASFGAGALSTETAFANFGSGAFLLGLLPHYQSSKKQLSTIASSEDSSVQYVREGTVNGAGNALAWLEKKQGEKELWKRLPGWLNQVDKNESEQPLLFINSVGGLGSPWWNNTIEPEFIITDNTASNPETDQASQAVAVIESIVFMVCINLEIMRHNQTLTRLRVSGGLSRLDGLCQRLADVSALPVERTNLSETTARGIAWLTAGRPDSWSRVEIELFHPGSNTALLERYAMFSTTLDNL